MSAVPVTTFFAGVLIAMALLLAANVMRLRAKHRALIGTAGQDDLNWAGRAHGNFVEYAPFFVIGLGLLEMGGTGAETLRMLGWAFVAARVCHAVAMLRPKMDALMWASRGLGVGGTFLLLGLMAWWLIV